MLMLTRQTPYGMRCRTYYYAVHWVLQTVACTQRVALSPRLVSLANDTKQCRDFEPQAQKLQPPPSFARGALAEADGIWQYSNKELQPQRMSTHTAPSNVA